MEQNAAKLCERVCSDIVERREDALAILDRQSDDLAVERERLLEKGARRFVHELDELAHVRVRDPQAGEIYGGRGTP